MTRAGGGAVTHFQHRLSPGGGGHEDEGRVFVEGPFGLVVGDGGVGFGVAGGTLHLPQGDALQQPDGDVGAAQRMGGDPPGDAGGARQAAHDRRGVVGLHPSAPLVVQQRPVGPAGDDGVQRLLSAGLSTIWSGLSPLPRIRRVGV